MVIFSIVMKEL